jgi:predicted ATPase
MANGAAQIAMVHQLRGEPEPGLARAQAAVASGKAQGMPYRVAVGKAVAGWAHAQSGAGQQGIREIREAIEMAEQIGANLDLPYFLALLADALICDARMEEAEKALKRALEQVRRARSFFYEAELLRLKAVVCVHRTGAAEAKEHFTAALKTATAQAARALQLRTLVSMVRLYPSDTALRTLLQNTRAAFSEGAGLPDLQSASALAGNSKAARS